MKNIIILVSFVLCMVANAFANCAEMHKQFASIIQTQKVVICRVAGLEKGRTDIMGMYFKMGSSDALLVYGINYDTMLYIDNDYPVHNTICIQNENYRAVKSIMSGDQIAAKLMSMKQCEPGYHEKYDSRNNYKSLHK